MKTFTKRRKRNGKVDTVDVLKKENVQLCNKEIDKNKETREKNENNITK